MNRNKFGSANKAVVVMVPRGGSPNHTADVGAQTMNRPIYIATRYSPVDNNATEKRSKWKDGRLRPLQIVVAVLCISMSPPSLGDQVYLLDSHTNALQPFAAYDPLFRDVLYESQTINYVDSDGHPMNPMPFKVVLVYIHEHGMLDGKYIGDYPIGGLTIEPGQTVTGSGWFWSRDDLSVTGLQPGQTATNGLTDGSFWLGYIDKGTVVYDDGSIDDSTWYNNGTVGTYTLHDNGKWTLSSEPDEFLVYYDEQGAPPESWRFRINGMPPHPATGTGPVTIDSIDIIAPFSITQKQASAFLHVSIDNGMPKLAISNSPPTSPVTIQRTTDLTTTNWTTMTVTNINYRNWIDITATGDNLRAYYRIHNAPQP